MQKANPSLTAVGKFGNMDSKAILMSGNILSRVKPYSFRSTAGAKECLPYSQGTTVRLPQPKLLYLNPVKNDTIITGLIVLIYKTSCAKNFRHTYSNTGSNIWIRSKVYCDMVSKL